MDAIWIVGAATLGIGVWLLIGPSTGGGGRSARHGRFDGADPSDRERSSWWDFSGDGGGDGGGGGD